MVEILYNSLTTYFSSLRTKGYIKDATVYKLLVLDFIQQVMETELEDYLIPTDISLMERVLFRFYQTTCEIPLSTKCVKCTPRTAISLSDFKMIPSETYYVGSRRIAFTGATLKITNISQIQPNSLKIYHWKKSLPDVSVMEENLPVSKSVTFKIPIEGALQEGDTYNFRASVRGLDGTEYHSNTFSIVVVAAPKLATMYYGSTHVDGSEGARQFVNTTAAEIMALNTHTAKAITGVNETTFIIHQTDNVHYLLIPTEEMELIHAEHGTVLVSTLWDKATQDGAYKQPYDAGVYNGKNYTKWFLYSPGGAFADDIRITVKNL